MEVADFYEKPVYVYQTKRCHIPENENLQDLINSYRNYNVI